MSKKITLEEAKAVVLAHRAAEEAERVAEARQYIGRYFKYLNNYGGSEPERWWMYGMVTGVEEWGRPKGLTFQHTSMDIVEIRQGDSINPVGGGWREIEASEFWFASKELLGVCMARLTPDVPLPSAPPAKPARKTRRR